MQRKCTRTPVLCLAAAAALAPPGARAQDAPLGSLLPRLLSEAVTMPSTAGGVAGNPHEAHFLPSVSQLEAPYALNSAIVAQLATFPLGSSSGGFTYFVEGRTGIPKRSSTNFGPAFAERSLTNGKGQFTAGVNYLPVRYERFEGLALEGGAIAFYLQHNDCCPGQNPVTGTPGGDTSLLNPAFEGDLVEARLSMDLKTQTAAFFANYGISDRIDLGVAIPVVRVDLEASMTSTIERLATSANPAIHSFGGDSPDTRTTRESGTATGLGDIVVRGKYRFLTAPGGGLAIGLDARLPTGNKEELLGTGATQIRPNLIYSADFGWFSPHYNIGYTFSSGSLARAVGTYALGDDVPTASVPGDVYDNVFPAGTPTAPVTDLKVPNELSYVAGFVLGVTPRFSISADVMGRTLLDVKRFGVQEVQYFFLEPEGTVGARTVRELRITTIGGRMNILLGVVGFKLNVGGTFLINANVLFPLNDQGLRAKVTPVVGIDYAF
jgi:hypothetical protein